MKNGVLISKLGLEVLQWWGLVVKPGIKKLAIQRSKELNKEKKGELNISIRQAYLGRKLLGSDFSQYAEPRAVQVAIYE